MAELSDRARELLAAQRERYLRSLVDKAAQLREVSDQIYDLQDAVHKIAGSAGLHGLDAIQQQAVVVEEAIKAGQDNSAINDRLQDLLLLIETTKS